jgi:hypothetical protein
MSIGDVLKIAFFVLLILALALAIMNYIQQASQPPQPVLAMNWPAGITYKGPDTTALAGWYCIENINSSNGFSIQLNAQFNNGEWGAQDVYMVTPWGQTGFDEAVWPCGYQGCQPISLKFVETGPASCAWLIIALKNGYAYIGYSLDGKSISWFEEYPVNATYILPSDNTGIVLAGYGNGNQAQLGRGTLVYLALYYWGNNSWVPAPVGVNQGLQTWETVNHAWEFTSGKCGGYVAWFGWNKTNPESPVLPSNLEPICPTSPGFRL